MNPTITSTTPKQPGNPTDNPTDGQPDRGSREPVSFEGHVGKRFHRARSTTLSVRVVRLMRVVHGALTAAPTLSSRHGASLASRASRPGGTRPSDRMDKELAASAFAPSRLGFGTGTRNTRAQRKAREPIASSPLRERIAVRAAKRLQRRHRLEEGLALLLADREGTLSNRPRNTRRGLAN